MNGGWAQVWMAVWNDEAFRQLPSDARLLFLWSWTNPTAAKCGLYHASVKQLQRGLEEPAADPQRVHDALQQLALKPLVSYDYDAEVIWVVNRARHANRSPKVAVSMRKEFDRCPPSPLKDEFADRYPQLIERGDDA